MTPPERSRFADGARSGRLASTLRLGAFAAALAAAPLAGCRGLLGIDDLDETAAGAGGAGGGKAGASSAGAGGGGKAGGKAKAGAGGVAGKAGAGGGAGKAGASGSGGAGGQPPVDTKACQNECLDSAGKKGLESYYGEVKDCACSELDPTGCKTVCGNDCDIKADEFGGKPKECISCIAQKTTSSLCSEVLIDCDKDCATFRDCIEACGGLRQPLRTAFAPIRASFSRPSS